MNEVLPTSEIESRFDSEWVLLGRPQTDEANQILRGEVLAHSRDRHEGYRRLLALRPGDYAMLYPGQMPENTAIVL
jgi:hypothetical protein